MIWDMKVSEEASIFIIWSSNLLSPTRQNFFTIQRKTACFFAFPLPFHRPRLLHWSSYDISATGSKYWQKLILQKVGKGMTAFSTQRKRKSKKRDWKELKLWQVNKIRLFLGPTDQRITDFFCSFASVVGKALEMVDKEKMEEGLVHHILNQG